VPTISPSDVASERSPFQGLGFYTEEDAKWFFGRMTERRIMLAHLRTARLTLLYAESGVGKSSLLRAGVAARLRELAVRTDGGRTRRFIPLVFTAWKDDPVQDLIGALRRLAPGAGDPDRQLDTAGDGAARPVSLAEAIAETAAATDATLAIMLDQFEEYFSYREARADRDRLADELAACITAPEVPANFLIAVREDAYGRLGDLFSGRINNVYDNYLHLEYMSRDAAREAIEGPVALFNAEHAPDEAMSLDPDLADAVLDEVRRGNLALRGRRADRDGGTSWSPATGDEVETPFLQLVMTRLWECERAQGSRVLRRTTLDDELGGAEAIVRNHVGRALAGLDGPQLEAATDIFGDLVTPSGAKVAHTAADLAQMTGQRADTVTSVLDRLYEERIVRAVDPAPGTSDARYEIFHDRLAAPILDWRDQQENVRLRRAREDAEREAESERRQARRFKRRAHITLVLALSLLAVLVALVIALRYAHEQSATARRQSAAATRATQAAVHDRAQARYFGLRTLAQSALSTRPDVSLLLDLAAYGESPQPIVKRDLVTTLNVARLSSPIAILHGHTDVVEGVAFSPDGGTLASVSGDKTVRLWRVSTAANYPLGAPLHSGAPLYSVAFAPNGRILASGSFNEVLLWNVARRAQEGVIRDHADTIASVAYSPDGRFLAAGGSNGSVLLLDARTHRRRVLVGSGGSPIRGLAFSRRADVLAVGVADTVIQFDPRTGARVGAPLIARDTVNAVAFSRDGRLLAAGAQKGHITLWDPVSGQELGRFGGRRPVNTIAFSPDGTTLFAAGEGTTVLWDVRKRQRIVGLAGHQGAIYSVANSPDGKLLASAGADRTITVWREPFGSVLGSPVVRAPQFTSVAWSRTGQLAAGEASGSVVLFRQSGDHQLVLPAPSADPGRVSDVAFDPAGHVLAASYDDGLIALWSLAGPHRLAVLPAGGGSVHAVAFDPRGRRLVAGYDDGSVRLWDVRTHVRIGHVLDGGPGKVYAVAFSPDGRTIASGGNARAITLWNSRTERPLNPPVIPLDDAVFSLAFSPNGRLLASGDADDAIHVWRLATRPYSAFRTFIGHSNFVRSVAFSPSGTTLASGSTDTTVRLWDVADGSELGSALTGPTASVESVAFRADGRRLASASRDGTVRVWPVATQPPSFAALRAEVCRFLGAGLSHAEWAEYAPGLPFQRTCRRTTPS
jgi:WD40 repeat protein